MEREELREKAISETREELESSVEKDQLLVKAVKQLDQLRNDFRGEMEKLRDWYSLHFPELEEELTEDDEFLNILEKFGVDRSEIEPFTEMADKSTGSDLEEPDRKMIEEMVSTLASMKETRENLKDYVEKGAKEEFGNLSGLLGPVLATRLVSLAGSLEELAKKPSSTVQVLGAEKALFRYLHGEGSPPKHGVLFHHDFVKSLPEERRGKMARFMANKAVMAARLDQYGDKDKSKELRDEASERYEELSG
jgi:nucleolar protein 56